MKIYPYQTRTLNWQYYKYSSHLLNISIVSVYQPPQGNQQAFLQSLRETLLEFGNSNNVILLGDLNIDYRQISTKSVRELKLFAREFNLTQHIGVLTRVTTSTATQIDYIFTNLGNITHAGVIDTMMSDHYATFIVLKKTKTVHEKVTFKCRQLKDLDKIYTCR